jgi:hypothetical protein
MERPSFGKRAKQRIWRDTRASAKGRITPFIIGVIGIVLGYFINFVWLHHNTAKQLAILSAVSLGGSYVAWFLAALIINTLRVPWLLDDESTELLNKEKRRAQDAEKNLAEINAAKQQHDFFSYLMHEGVALSVLIVTCQTDAKFASWDQQLDEWIKSVQEAMQDMRLPTDAVEFVRAGEYAEPVKGVINTGSKQEERARELAKYQEYLAEFVRRRLA